MQFIILTQERHTPRNFYGRCPAGRSRHKVKISVCLFVMSLFQGDAARRREASYDVDRLLLMAPIDPWRNSAPDFGAVAFCATNIEDFRTPLTSTSSTISSTYPSQKRSKGWTRSTTQYRVYTQTVGTVEQEYRHERMHCSRLLSGDNEVLAQALVLHRAS